MKATVVIRRVRDGKLTKELDEKLAEATEHVRKNGAKAKVVLTLELHPFGNAQAYLDGNVKVTLANGKTSPTLFDITPEGNLVPEEAADEDEEEELCIAA